MASNPDQHNTRQTRCNITQVTHTEEKAETQRIWVQLPQLQPHIFGSTHFSPHYHETACRSTGLCKGLLEYELAELALLPTPPRLFLTSPEVPWFLLPASCVPLETPLQSCSTADMPVCT